MSARKFTVAEDGVIKKFYKTKTNKEIAEILNNQYSLTQIKHRAKALGVKKNRETISNSNRTKAGAWEDWEIEILKRHYVKLGIDYVHSLLPNRTPTSIKHKASRLGLKLDKALRNFAVGPKEHSKETRKKMSLLRKGVRFLEAHKQSMRLSTKRGEEHPNWKGGRSFAPYGPEFNNKLKGSIKKRDSFQCQKCKKKLPYKKLVIHHIDYNKTISESFNLITLCKNCHTHHHLNCSGEEQKQEQLLFLEYVSQFEKVS